MLEITRHTTLIDAAMVYTPHFRRSKMAGINSLLLDGVGGGEGETRKHLFMIFSFKSLYLILQSVKWQGGVKETRESWTEEGRASEGCLAHLLSCQALLASCREGKWSLKPLVRNFSLV